MAYMYWSSRLLTKTTVNIKIIFLLAFKLKCQFHNGGDNLMNKSMWTDNMIGLE